MFSPGAYLPIDRRIAIIEKKSLPEWDTGATLFADISGFTPLTETLVRELGPKRGIEELTAQINSVYAALISEVHRFGGCVIGFSGDAITCWFGNWLDIEDNPALLAAACAQAMQYAMRFFLNIRTPGGSTQSLHIKISVTTGYVRRFVVGDPHIKRFDVLAGETVNRMALGMSIAQKGEVIVGSAMLTELKETLKIKGRRKTRGQIFGVLDGISVLVETVSWQETTGSYLDIEYEEAWVLRPVGAQLRRGAEQYLAEFRPAVALFLKFGGLDYDNDEQVVRKLDVYIQKVQRILQKYGGSLIQLTTGDKGSYLYAAFGAPVAYNNNTSRAVLAAAEMREASAQFDFIAGIQIGVGKGMMRVGLYGSPTRRTYGVLGNAVNTAARLMTNAPKNQILVTRKIVGETGQHFAYQRLDDLTVGGVKKRVFLYARQKTDKIIEPITQPRFARPRIRLIGRKQEQRLLNERLERAYKERKGGLVVVEGEAGMGKTRLIENLLSNSRRLRLKTASGSGNSIEKTAPYYVWRNIFRQLLEVDIQVSEAEQQQQVIALFDTLPGFSTLAPLLNVVLPMDMSETRTTMRLRGETRADQVKKYLAQVLRDIFEGAPKLIIIDDAQWLDPASWALIRQIYEKAPAILLVVAALSATKSPEYASLLRMDNVTRVRLKPLAEDEAMELVQACLGVETIPQTTADIVFAKTEGHPLYLQEMAYALRESGLVNPQSQALTTDQDAQPGQEVKLPQTIEGVITSRIDSLPAGEQLTLKVASVIGQIFSFKTLKDIHPSKLSATQLSKELNALAQLDITPINKGKAEDDGGPKFTFKHAATQEVAYNKLLFSQRKKLHREIALWHTRNLASAQEPRYGSIARHWENAGNSSKQLEYLDKAGEHSLNKGAYSEAVQYYGKALKAILDEKEHHLQQAFWLRQLAQAHYGLGMLKESIRNAERSLALLGKPYPSSPLGQKLFLLRQFIIQGFHMIGVIRKVRSGIHRKIILEETRNHNLLVELHLLDVHHQGLIASVLRAVNLAERTDSYPDLIAGYRLGCRVAGVYGLPWLAARYRAKTLEYLDETQPPAIQLAALTSICTHHIGLGEWEEARQLSEKAGHFAGQLEHRLERAKYLHMLCQFHSFQGRLARSAKNAEQLLALAAQSHDSRYKIWAYQGLAKNYLQLERYDKAITAGERALKIIEKRLKYTYEASVRGITAAAYLRSEQTEQAVAVMEPVVEQLETSPTSSWMLLDAYIGFVEVRLSVWREERTQKGGSAASQTLARKAVADMFRFANKFPIAQTRAWLYRGRYNQILGKHKQAHHAFIKSLTWAKRMEMPYEQGLANFEIAFHLPEESPARQEHLRQAVRIFSKLGIKDKVF